MSQDLRLRLEDAEAAAKAALDAQRRMAFLARASAELAASLDYETTLATVARLAVPELADWTAVHVLEEDGSLHRVVVAHHDPVRVQFVEGLLQEYPTPPDSPHGLHQVLRTGRPDFIPDITPDLLSAVAVDARHRELLNALQLHSSIVVPLIARDQVLGAITFVQAESGRRYGEADVVLLEELARRAAVAVENARLVSELERQKQHLEDQAIELEAQREELRAQADELAATAERLEQAGREKAALLESTGQGIYGVDPQGRCTFINPAAAALLGYVPAEVLGRNMHELVHHTRADGSPYPESECPITASFRQGRPVRSAEEPLWRRDGTSFVGEYSAHPVLAGGRITGAVVAIRDVTERLRAEAELREHQQRLQTALESVRQAKDAAEHANHAKSEFLAAMSHELRTPLNAIAGYLDLLDIGVHGQITEVQRHSLQRIKRNQEYLLRLINDILHFAKIEAGHVHFDLVEFPLADVLKAIEPLARGQADARGLSYRSGAADRINLRADPERVQQILLNLISNAIKFTEPGGSVRVSVEANGASAAVHISDTGQGIPADQLEAVFDPFFQVKPGRYEASPQGVGLGLAISRDLARSMGGDVTVQSEVGRGSRFTLTLPRAPSLPR